MLPSLDIVKIDGLTYLLFDTNDLISRSVRRGGFEVDLHRVTSELLKDVKDGVVIDIGANLGSYTVPLAKTNPHLLFHSFEPQKIINYQLCSNVLLNHLDNVIVHRTCLSNSTWEKEITVPDYSREVNIGAFSVDDEVRNRSDYCVVTKGEVELIKAIRLDDLQLKNVRVIKIDVEGHEMEVLDGAIETIRSNNYPPIIFEAWTSKLTERRDKLFDYLSNLGYDIRRMGDNNLAIKSK